MPPSYPTLTLKPGRERSVRHRHPWLFSGAVARLPDAPDGAIIRLASADDVTLAYGHYAPGRPIVCRLFAFTDAPAPVFGPAFWRDKLRLALDYRRRIGLPPDTNMYRAVNAEGDGLPGIVVDAYADVAVVQLRTAGAAALEGLLLDALAEQGWKHVFRKDEPDADVRQSGWLRGGMDAVEGLEYGLKFIVRPAEGQKTGFYLDQREHRRYVEGLAAGRTVLNAFSYTGGFSAYALRGGAKRVVSVDLSGRTEAWCNESIALNCGPNAPHSFVKADCFDYLRTVERDEFDLIVLDPPAFTKHLSTVDKAARGYKDLNLKAMQVIRSGGLLVTFSCSQHVSPDLFRKIIYGAAADAGRPVRVIRQLGHSFDHPVDIFHPEGDYLKGLAVWVD